MKTKLSINRDLERRILTLLASHKGIGAVATDTGLPINAVLDIANHHGHPDIPAIEQALAAMDAEDRDTQATTAGSRGETSAGRELRTVPVESVRPDPENPREELTGIEDLADSIREVGLLQPIVVRQRAGQLIVVAGHRRLAAVQHLAWGQVDVVVTKDMRPDEILAAMIIENGQRTDLDPIEEARAFSRLKHLQQLNSRDLAKRIGRSQPFVDDRLRLLDLPPEDQDRVRNGQMGTTHGTAKARVLSGNVRSTGGRIPHLGADHTLAGRARARCTKVHQLKKTLVGKTACGDCWESVIRADERHHLAQAAINTTCATCGHHPEPQEATA